MLHFPRSCPQTLEDETDPPGWFTPFFRFLLLLQAGGHRAMLRVNLCPRRFVMQLAVHEPPVMRSDPLFALKLSELKVLRIYEELRTQFRKQTNKKKSLLSKSEKSMLNSAAILT